MPSKHPCPPGTKNTYKIAPQKTSITFQPCGVTSWNPHDVEHRYCGRCHRFIDPLYAPLEEANAQPGRTVCPRTNWSEA